MILVSDATGGLEARTVRWRDRLTVRGRASGLDRALAAGTPPEASVPLALHADRLVRPCNRRQVAGNLDHVLAEVRASGRPGHPAVPLRRQQIIEAQAELAETACRLRNPGPVAAQGVAMLRLLLSDGQGPLYGPGRDEDLTVVLRRCRMALDEL